MFDVRLQMSNIVNQTSNIKHPRSRSLQENTRLSSLPRAQPPARLFLANIPTWKHLFPFRTQ